MLTPDPYVPDAITKAMARRPPPAPASPSYFSQAANSPYMMGGPNGTASFVAQNMLKGRTVDPSAPAPGATASANSVGATAPASRVVFDPTDAQAAALHPAGMSRLAQGVSRSEIPGVYMARGRDGSTMFSNITGPDGQPTFAGSAEEAQGGLGMGRRGATYAGGSQADPRYSSNPVTPGWNEGDGAQGGAVDRFAGQVNPNGMPAPQGAAGMTWANASGGLTGNAVGNMIDSRTSPFQVQADMQDLATKIHDDPNASNPQVAAANAQAMQRMKGAYYDQLNRFYGGNGAEASMLSGVTGAGGIPLLPGMGMGTGTGGGRGGVGTTYKDFATGRADTENAATNAAKAQADAQLKQEAQNEAQAQNIIKTLPKDQVAQLKQLGISPTDYAHMSQFVQQHGDIESADPQVTSMRQHIQRLVMRGVMQGRGMSGAFGNAVHLEHSPFIDVNNPAKYPDYTMGSDQFGNATLTPEGGEPVYLNKPSSLLATSQGNSPMLRAAYGDPVLQKIIMQLAQPSGMDRRGP
jgi:hypothetical protein